MTNPSSEPHGAPGRVDRAPTRGWAHWLPVLSTLLLLAVAAKRIKTCVTAQDPFWYIGLARAILGGRSDPAEFAHGLSYVSPGFPLLLAGCIKLFGVYAPYWLNPVLAVGFVLLYAELVRHLFPSRYAVAILVPATLFTLAAGYGLNIHFLLYPFRGMPVYFLAVLGMTLLVVRARPTGKASAYVLAGCPFAAALAIREPAVFAMAGAALWILLAGGLRNRRAWQTLGWFLLPVAIGLVAVAAVVIAQGRALNNQLESWLTIVSDEGPAQFLYTARVMGGYLMQSIHGPGIVLAGIGLWSCRRNLAVLCFFVVPALAFFAFYSLYIPHYRYSLTVLVFLCPLIGAGLLWLADALHRRLPRAQIPWALAVLLIAAGAFTVRSMEPWGRKVTSRQVDAFRRTLAELAPEGGVAFVDQTCRYLVDALVCYSDLAVRSPMQVGTELAAGQRCFYFLPLDQNGYYEGYLNGSLDPLGLPPARVLPFYARQEQVLNPDGTPLVIVVANGHFAVQEVLPWTDHQVRQRFVLAEAGGHTIWLDFGEHAPGAVADIHIEDRDGSVLVAWEQVPARHIQGLYAPGSQTGTGLCVLEVRSDAALPPTVIQGVAADGRTAKFRLDHTRSLSTHYWMRPPFSAPQDSQKQIGQLDPSGRLVLPVPRAVGDRTVEYRLALSVPADTTGQLLHITGPDGISTPWPADRPQSYASFTAAPPHEQEQVAAELALTRTSGRPGARVAEVAILVQ